jgi:hypothetical protein
LTGASPVPYTFIVPDGTRNSSEKIAMSRTIKFTKGGGPEVFEFIETKVKAPIPHEVRIKAKAIGLAAAAEPAYMKCLFDTFAGLANGTVAKPDEVFDNLPAIIGRKPKALGDFARRHADIFRY